MPLYSINVRCCLDKLDAETIFCDSIKVNFNEEYMNTLSKIKPYLPHDIGNVTQVVSPAVAGIIAAGNGGLLEAFSIFGRNQLATTVLKMFFKNLKLHAIANNKPHSFNNVLSGKVMAVTTGALYLFFYAKQYTYTTIALGGLALVTILSRLAHEQGSVEQIFFTLALTLTGFISNAFMGRTFLDKIFAGVSVLAIVNIGREFLIKVGKSAT